MCEKSWLSLESTAKDYLKLHLKELYDNRDDNFANGRDVRNLFENALANQANRLAVKNEITDEELLTLTFDDFSNNFKFGVISSKLGLTSSCF